MPKLNISAVLMVFLFCAGSALAQKYTCINRSITLSVVRLNGANRVDVLGTEFRGVFRRNSVIIKSITLDQGPRRLLVLLDLSGSMTGKVSEDWDVLFEVARSLINQMPSDVQIGLVFFADRMEPAVPLTFARQPLLDALGKKRALQATFERKDSLTAMRDAIHDSIGMFGQPEFGDAIYVISDGYDNRSGISSEALAKELAASGIRLFAFALLVKEKSMISIIGNGPRELQNIVDETGGLSVGLTRSSDRDTSDPMLRALSLTPEELHEELLFQFRQIVEVFRLDIQLPGYLSKPEDWKLDWVGLDKSAQKNYMMVYPKVLGACR